MKNLLALATLTVALAVTTAPPAFAQSANAASIIKDVGCTGFVPTADGSFGSLLFSTDMMAVSTSSGVSTLTCKFDIPAGSEPARATRASGFGCGTFLGGTTDSRMTASPGGNATITCRIHHAN